MGPERSSEVLGGVTGLRIVGRIGIGSRIYFNAEQTHTFFTASGTQPPRQPNLLLLILSLPTSLLCFPMTKRVDDLSSQ